MEGSHIIFHESKLCLYTQIDLRMFGILLLQLLSIWLLSPSKIITIIIIKLVLLQQCIEQQTDSPGL